MMDTVLRIMTWNANGLVHRKQELEEFLYSENIDIALISETHFTNKSYLKIRGYSMYYTTHPSGRAHAGSAIIVKNGIKHHEQKEVRMD